MQRIAVIASCRLFSSLNSEAVALLADASKVCTTPAGHLILRRGEIKNSLYVIAAGTVRFYLSSPDGREFCLEMAGRCTAIDVLSLVGGGGALTHVAAVEPSTLLIIPRSSIDLTLGTYHYCDAVVRLLAEQLQQMSSVLEDVALRTLEERVARVLYRLHRHSLANPAMRVHRLNQTVIASMANGTRSKVNAKLHNLRRLGAIEIQNGIIIVRREDLLVDRSRPAEIR